MTTKNKIQSHLRKYELRREKLRVQYPNWKNNVGNPEYRKRVRRINEMIRNYNKRIDRIEKMHSYYAKIDSLVCEFLVLEDPIQNSSKHHHNSKLYGTARSLFCKWIMENTNGSFWGTLLAEYIGFADTSSIRRRRMEFTRSFATNKGNKELWQQFKLFIQDYGGSAIVMQQYKQAS